MVKSKGLGDDIEKVTTALGIKAVVESLFDDCGCEKRKEVLNKMFPYHRTECLTEAEFQYLDLFFVLEKNTISQQEKIMLLTIFNRVFNQKRQMSNCSSCWVEIVDKLKSIYTEYKNNK